ncbi:hypothetical protein [Mycobacterium sp. D16R24]|uniref:hypothetical protein n=1 Tax=Mycobacterium sp. D16R24 TaxID=1855656 RepID=UPI001116FD01|nr:hypothetical protein [Mycobacterium sp. D16R24]
MTQEFLKSEYIDHTYAGWPIDQRLEGFLRHRNIAKTSYDGDVHNVILDCIMAHIGKQSHGSFGGDGY